MKKILYAFALIALSCNNHSDKGKFTINGELKNVADQKVFLEELFFSQRNPESVDTADIKQGKFVLTAIAPEEGLYRLRLEKDSTGFIFINDNPTIGFKADGNNINFNSSLFNTPANASLAKFIAHSDSLREIMDTYYVSVQMKLAQKVSETDSSLIAEKTGFETYKESLTKYCFQFADTASNAVLAVFAVTSAPIEVEKLQLPLQKLSTRFPKSGAVATAMTTIKQIAATKEQPQQKAAPGPIQPGSIAPELTMADTTGKAFSLSSLRGKFVLVDFWASWCGPCRMENPNVVKAFNKFKNKNFTILGVSLDKDKKAWINAINADKLTWQHISDLQYWNSAAVSTYSFESIPYNVLIDPQGKIIATALQGEELEAKLAEVLQ